MDQQSVSIMYNICVFCLIFIKSAYLHSHSYLQCCKEMVI